MIDINTILVGYDGFSRDEGLPPLAVALAQEHNARLHVVHILPEIKHHFWQSKKETAQALHEALHSDRLEALAALIESLGIPEATVAVREGKPGQALMAEADAVDADLVIVCDEPIHRKRTRGFGVTTMRLLRECARPVLAVRARQGIHHEAILAAVDLGPEGAAENSPNAKIIHLASQIAKRAKAPGLTIFHAWSFWGEQLLRSKGRMSGEEVDQLLAETRIARETMLEKLLASHQQDLAGLEVKIQIEKGDPREMLPEILERDAIELVVMGTVTRTGVPGFLIGNTAERILNQLTCSVLTVKPEGFKAR